MDPFSHFEFSLTPNKKPILGALQIFVYIHLYSGEMIQSDLRIFFKWVGEKPPTRNDLEIKFLVIPTTLDASYIQIEFLCSTILLKPQLGCIKLCIKYNIVG